MFRLSCRGIEDASEQAAAIGCTVPQVHEARRRLKYHGERIKAQDAQAEAQRMKAARERAQAERERIESIEDRIESIEKEAVR